MTTIIAVAAKLDLDQLIGYLETTTDDQWCQDFVRSRDRSQSCLMGHIFNYGGGDTPVTDSKAHQTAGGLLWDWFEEFVATTYMVYPVNDGQNPNYPQPTPKARCIAYLKDLRDGKELTSAQITERDAIHQAIRACFR